MATNPPPPDFNQEPPAADEPPAPDPWAPLTQRGFDPSRYDPEAIVNGANLYTALRSRDYQEGAIADVLRHAGFPEGLSVRELREMAQQAQQQDPWEAMNQPQDEQGYYEPQAPAFDPRQLQSAIDAEIERRFAERDRQAAERERQQAFEAEFTREAQRVAKANDFDEEEVVWLAAQANMLRESMPYATTQQVMDAAGERIVGRLNKRLQALAQRQESAPSGGMPPGPTPSDQQVPQNAEEARAAARQFFTN